MKANFFLVAIVGLNALGCKPANGPETLKADALTSSTRTVSLIVPNAGPSAAILGTGGQTPPPPRDESTEAIHRAVMELLADRR